MSGKKEARVTIARSEIEKLRKQASRADQLAHRNRLLEKQESLRKQRIEKLDQVIRRQDERAGQYEKTLNQLQNGINDIEREVDRKFRDQQARFRREIAEAAQNQREYTDFRVEEVRSLLFNEIRKQSDLFQEALIRQESRLNHKIEGVADAMQARLMSQKKTAEDWIRSAEDELWFIKDNFPYQRFAPDEIREIEQTLQTAAGDIRAGNFEAAIVTGRNGLINVKALRKQLEIAEIEWEYQYQTAEEALLNTLDRIGANRCYTLRMDMFEGREVELDVDYWTNGRWTKLKQRLSDLHRGLHKKSGKLPVEGLKNIRKTAKAAEFELDELEETAIDALLSSIKRRDIQEQICEKLAESGYHLVDASYEGEDFRGAYYLKMRNGNSEEIVTVVAPEMSETGGEPFANRLTFNFYDRSPNDRVRLERAKEIGGMLQQEDMNVSDLRSIEGYDNRNAQDEVRDFDAVRKTTVK